MHFGKNIFPHTYTPNNQAYLSVMGLAYVEFTSLSDPSDAGVDELSIKAVTQFEAEKLKVVQLRPITRKFCDVQQVM